MLINTGESGIVYCMECRKYVGLTLTWDVLKPVLTFPNSSELKRLTLTWDVLKHVSKSYIFRCNIKINFNMGCIETRLMYTAITDNP